MRVVAEFYCNGSLVESPSEEQLQALAQRYVLRLLQLGFPDAKLSLRVTATGGGTSKQHVDR